ncbi:hypothetical protein [Roseicella sp. DB1501]|uniref:hypothetical protein n=1 Tax=Roseicella sp. DB1501 TaxID=2730925 RepID=UPI0014925627|nr:hypothetical protein [Roseicella sp. DB1501]NOG70055.1 hypothetical protein [Roseicella sp. DB1501]
MVQSSRPTDATDEDQAGHRKDQPVQMRGHLALLEENQGEIPWCGPAALALATGRGYAETSHLLRSVAPGWYPPEGPIVTAYWRDLLGVLDGLGIPYEPVALPERRRSLLRFVRDGLEEGWYLLRITDHFLLLRSHGFGLAVLYDNRHTGVLVGKKTHGMRHVTHAVRLPGGPSGAV